ncbi:hypothetical protein CC85DRAFT_329884 [Cutaneotrichosporon oleaginosum]|uniref:Calponin-homology (CH) domain-containing protein n=1 Tax=Cutaneotrichosporon oleaginosum TaxID=879819 RepID=A0A0J1AYT3_9TREE|nr:uncharacterized protein CC85DRAFT_329884 [Cutaneotrichosporon oleaginosum]KLT40479.1 hypothetical protein CC85DRAFT_329884 [Cutaneotrichosporon oleaginosum]TXT15330.1 hypothetical protein COLE_01523 [Cutaneotrichosporon oleaginosum]
MTTALEPSPPPLVIQRTGDSGCASDTTHTTVDTLPSSVDGDEPSPLKDTLRRKYHRHVSRSAAKRDSVATLPSIRDLQLHFSGGGVVHRDGVGVGIRASPLGSVAERTERKPWKNVALNRIAPSDARKEANMLARDVSATWAAEGAPSDLRKVFVDTAAAVRRMRTLALSLASAGRRVSTPRAPASFSVPSRPTGVGAAPRSVSAPILGIDHAAPLRRAALDVLGQLRTLEERLRNSLPMLVVNGELADSPVQDHIQLSPSATSGASCADEWSEDEEYDINEAARIAEATSSRPPWEERIVADAHGYRAVGDEEWAAESGAARDAVVRWVEVVGRLFREAPAGPADEWAGLEGIDRLYAFLKAHLSPEHAALLPSPGDALLDRLSDGFLLAHAFNAYLLTSTRPWGFVPDEDLHDTLGAEEGEWTFRRAENLTSWAAAVRMRFNIPIAMPTPPTAPKAAAQAALGRRRSIQVNEFDPLVVAKRADGWERMLRTIIDAWMMEAAREVQNCAKPIEAGDSEGAV